MSVSRDLHIFQWSLLFYLFNGLETSHSYTNSNSILFTCCFWASKHSLYQFTFKISKNKSIRFVFLHIFLAIFYRNLTFLYLTLDHCHPFLSVLSRSQSGQHAFCLSICSVLHYKTTLI